MRINSNIERLVNDIVDGFENELDYEKVYSIVETLINDGSYTLSELWEINNNDSTEMYHILAMNGDFHKESVNENKSMKKNKIRITESKLRQIVNESVKNVLNEAMSTDYRSALKQIFTKSFGNLSDNEKQFLYDLLSNETWETVYVALETLKPYNPKKKVNEGKDIISMESIYNQVLEHIVNFLERGDMEIKFGNMNEQSFEVYLPLSEKYLEISYMGKTINIPLNKRVEDLSDESIARSIMEGFVKLYSN